MTNPFILCFVRSALLMPSNHVYEPTWTWLVRLYLTLTYDTVALVHSSIACMISSFKVALDL